MLGGRPEVLQKKASYNARVSGLLRSLQCEGGVAPGLSWLKQSRPSPSGVKQVEAIEMDRQQGIKILIDDPLLITTAAA